MCTIYALTVIAAAGFGVLAQPEDTEIVVNEDMLVGITYFAGWWEESPNKWERPDRSDWRPDFEDRIPLLGEYNTQETMDQEIIAAAENDVDFFIILWYPMHEISSEDIHREYLNLGVAHFMASPEANRMKFMVEYCNHPPFHTRTIEQWQDCIHEWIEMFKHPSYL